MVKLENFSYDFILDDIEDNDGSKMISLEIICKDSRDSIFIMDELIRSLGTTDKLFTLRRTENESN